VSKRNYNAPWVYSVVTFLHKDLFKRPIRLDWTGQYTGKEMRHMLQGRMLWLWAPRHSEQPMLVVNIHQAGSADAELQQQVWLAVQEAMQARYPEAQGIVSETPMDFPLGNANETLNPFNASAHGQRIGYSPGNAICRTSTLSSKLVCQR
jgi:hypothetical protein